MECESSPTFTVDPARLSSGEYDGRDRIAGEGDIKRAYSADLIATQGKIRNPFRWQGSLWTTVAIVGCGLQGEKCEAYRLVPLKAFTSMPTTYRDKTGTKDGAESARNDPNGFYDRITVKHGKETYVMQGPPGIFVPAPERPEAKPEPTQMDMFL